MNEAFLYSWFGLTDGVVTTGAEDMEPLRKR